MDEINIPTEYLHRIADHCPRALSVFLLCWQTGQVDITLTDERIKNFCLSKTKIKNDLRSLAKEGLLEYHDNGEVLSVTLAQYSEE